ncbi:catalase family peroxidase [Paraburkholderia phosphatilytica]|uniref:catalase family peroxidase n=1 Tax=Paraburkholderia phosphatilytica TaxID=2282883 RepID=UPI000E46740A|nr:catalase family peroxidase [Paraburkholderia phosphatilytica]
MPPSPSSPSRRFGLLLRWFVVLAVPAALAALFVWCAGWLSSRPTAPRIVDAFEATTSSHPGFRRNHAKGICIAGHFDSNGAGTALSRASVFVRGAYPVVGRLSIPGGDPDQQDNEGTVRSFALRIALPYDEEWRLAMNSTPIFAVRTPQELFAQLHAEARNARTGHSDPAKMEAFLAAHPDARAFRAWLDAHPPSSRFDNAAYFGISTFKATDSHDQTRFVRWQITPDHPYSPVEAGEARDPDFLAHGLVTQLQRGPLRWHLMFEVALPGDPIDDSTQQWPASRERTWIDTGTLVIDRAAPQIDGPCRDIVFDPLMLPDGLAPSDDPLLASRSSTYRVSFDRRTREESAADAAHR